MQVQSRSDGRTERMSRWSIGSNTSSAPAPPRWWCWRWWPIRWWPSCSTTPPGNWCSAMPCCSGYLIISACCSTVAFALFEVSTIFQLHDLMSLDSSIKSEIGAEKLIKRGYFVLAVSSVINFLSVLYFLALAWHTTSGHSTAFPLDNLPAPWNWLYYAVHASAYTAVLFLAGIFGERPKSGKEVILATQRALEQQALERWRMQKEAQIEDMMRRGIPLGAVAAALASPETAERIAVLEAATTGNMSALDAARLNVQRAGHDLSLLDGLRTTGKALSAGTPVGDRGCGARRGRISRRWP